MLSLAVSGYSEESVKRQLHSVKGSRVIKFRFDLLNRHDIKIGELTADTSGIVSLNSLAQIKRTGRFKFKQNELQDVDWLNDRVQPFFMLRMHDGGWAEWPLGIFLISSPTRQEENGQIYRSVEAYDQSLILVEDKFDTRYRIASGTKYITAINDILNSAGIWKINILAHPGTLKRDVEFEIGTSKLEAINKLLQEINYTSIWVDENGYFTALPYILPVDKEAEYEYRNNELSIIEPGSTEELDLFSIANKWVVVTSNPDVPPLVSTYTNELATSPTSTVNRGRTIVDFRQIEDACNQATLDAYVRRIAYEASQVYGKFIFSTALMPHHSYMNSLYIEHTKFGIADKYTETSWEMQLAAGGSMSHACRKVVEI